MTSKKRKPIVVSEKRAFKPERFDLIPAAPGENEGTGSGSDLPYYGRWSDRDETRVGLVVPQDERTSHSLDKTGRTMGDVFRELFIEGKIGVLLILGFVCMFGAILWQDNNAGRLQTWETSLPSVVKILVCAIVCWLLYLCLRAASRRTKQR